MSGKSKFYVMWRDDGLKSNGLSIEEGTSRDEVFSQFQSLNPYKRITYLTRSPRMDAKVRIEGHNVQSISLVEDAA